MGMYDDILYLPHHVSSRHPRMSLHDRAAQFSPFAALTGFESAIAETGRLTFDRTELAEDAKAALDRKLLQLENLVCQTPYTTVTYFRPDACKNGGSYVQLGGHVWKVDRYKKTIVFTTGEEISLDEIINIKCDRTAGL